MAAAGARGAAPAGKIVQVDIVHHTHTDVGYTSAPAVVRDQQMRYIDIAIDACRADASFRWTIESLVELDDWWRAAPPPRKAALEALVDAGQIDVMGMPFNQTPCMDALQWKQATSWVPDALWKRMKIRAAMQNDVNGIPRACAKALLDKGISHLLVGLNADSGGPPFRRPDAFWWKQPDGRRMFIWLGEHYGSAMNYLKAARKDPRMLADEASVRAAHHDFAAHMDDLLKEGYAFDRLILTFTHPQHYDNGSPYPTLGPFVAAWNRLGLEPKLRLTTATNAVFEMEKTIGGALPELTGEWTDWWANGDASSPREVAASRAGKRAVNAAVSPLFGPMPARGDATVETVLKDLCLFDEHTWGADRSISQPYSLRTLGQFVEKSILAFRPMGLAEELLMRRVRGKVDPLAEGIYAVNPWNAEVSGWVGAPGDKQRFWVDRLAARTVALKKDVAPAASGTPTVELDATGWPKAVSWQGMKKPLFDGAVGEFLAVSFAPPADRRTIAGLHSKPDAAKRAAAVRESVASFAAATREETAYTVVFQQAFRHDRIADAHRTIELWKTEPRARVTVRFDRLSSMAPEVLYLAFNLPEGVDMPQFSSGGIPYTPYRDQLKGSCKDYFAIDGWARFSGDGDRLWVTRDAPLVAVGGQHAVERHQVEPANHNRILAMVFDNCWHTNFVADSHGTFEFQFDLVWREKIEHPGELSQALASDPILVVNGAVKETKPELDWLYRP